MNKKSPAAHAIIRELCDGENASKLKSPRRKKMGSSVGGPTCSSTMSKAPRRLLVTRIYMRNSDMSVQVNAMVFQFVRSHVNCSDSRPLYRRTASMTVPTATEGNTAAIKGSVRAKMVDSTNPRSMRQVSGKLPASRVSSTWANDDHRPSMSSGPRAEKAPRAAVVCTKLMPIRIVALLMMALSPVFKDRNRCNPRNETKKHMKETAKKFATQRTYFGQHSRHVDPLSWKPSAHTPQSGPV